MHTSLSAEGVADAAWRLLQARADTPLMRLPRLVAPPDLERGYAIQCAVHETRDAQVAAFKIGMTDPASRRRAGLDAPILGRLAPCDLRASPAKIAVNGRHIRIVESEIIFEIGADLTLSNAPATAADVAAATRALYAGVEVCNSRFTEDVDWPSIVADNSNADLLVIGERLDDGAMEALIEGREMSVVLAFATGRRIEGSTARVCGNPLEAVAWLANTLAARGERLCCGQLVASGSCTGLVSAGFDEAVVATFGASGAAAKMEFVREGDR